MAIPAAVNMAMDSDNPTLIKQVSLDLLDGISAKFPSHTYKYNYYVMTH